jgi:hypothetical protein
MLGVGMSLLLTYRRLMLVERQFLRSSWQENSWQTTQMCRECTLR